MLAAQSADVESVKIDDDTEIPAEDMCLFTHSFSVCAEQPIFSAMEIKAAQREGCSPSCSSTIRTARARISGANLFVVLLIDPSSQELGPPAVHSLCDRRLRIGRIEELNDDFEFLGLALAEKVDRQAMREMRRHFNAKNGVLCMSKTWGSPLMWTHYADSHKGMVLGFDVPAHAFYEVKYVDKRPKAD